MPEDFEQKIVDAFISNLSNGRNAAGFRKELKPILNDLVKQAREQGCEEGLRYADIHRPSPHDTEKISDLVKRLVAQRFNDEKEKV